MKNLNYFNQFKNITQLVPEIFFVIYASQFLPEMPKVLENKFNHPVFHILIIYAYIWFRFSFIIQKHGMIIPLVLSSLIILLIYSIRYYYNSNENFHIPNKKFIIKSISPDAEYLYTHCDGNLSTEDVVNTKIQDYLNHSKDVILSLQDYVHINRPTYKTKSDPNNIDPN